MFIALDQLAFRMTRTIVVLLAVIVILSSPAMAVTIMEEDFGSDMLDTSRWQTYLDNRYNGNVYVDVNRSACRIENRGWLATVDQYRPGKRKKGGVGTLEISGVYTFGSDDDYFELCTRADLTVSGDNAQIENAICFTLSPVIIDGGEMRIQGHGYYINEKKGKPRCNFKNSRRDVVTSGGDSFTFHIKDDGKYLRFYAVETTCDPSVLEDCQLMYVYAKCKHLRRRGYHIVAYNRENDGTVSYHAWLEWLTISGTRATKFVPDFKDVQKYNEMVPLNDNYFRDNDGLREYNMFDEAGMSRLKYEIDDDSSIIDFIVANITDLLNGVTFCPYSKTKYVASGLVTVEDGVCITITPEEISITVYKAGELNLVSTGFLSVDGRGEISATVVFDHEARTLEASAAANGKLVVVMGKIKLRSKVKFKGGITLDLDKNGLDFDVNLELKMRFCFKKQCKKMKKAN